MTYNLVWLLLFAILGSTAELVLWDGINLGSGVVTANQSNQCHMVPEERSWLGIFHQLDLTQPVCLSYSWSGDTFLPYGGSLTIFENTQFFFRISAPSDGWSFGSNLCQKWVQHTSYGSVNLSSFEHLGSPHVWHTMCFSLDSTGANI